MKTFMEPKNNQVPEYRYVCYVKGKKNFGAYSCWTPYMHQTFFRESQNIGLKNFV